MKRRIGKILISLGIICVIAAVSLLCYNKAAESRAAQDSEDAVQVIMDLIDTIKNKDTDSSDTGSESDTSTVADTSSAYTDDEAVYNEETGTVTIAQREYIGYISIPALGLNLPVQKEWSLSNLKASPCLYYYSKNTDTTVICAHNYRTHFKNIGLLEENSIITFTSLTGDVNYYYVKTITETAPEHATDMVSDRWDLTLFTCDYTGNTRVTVRCLRAE